MFKKVKVASSTGSDKGKGKATAAGEQVDLTKDIYGEVLDLTDD